MTTPNKIDSNITSAAYAEESSLKVLPGVVTNGVSDETQAVWYDLEPNSYSDYGSNITTIARAPISGDRQRRKGSTTDLDASGGLNQDLTQSNLTRLLQGFFFADARQKPTTAPITGAVGVTITSADATKYNAASGLGSFLANHLILASGFTNSGNNGLKLVTASAAGSVTVGGLTVEASPPVAAKLHAVGWQFAAGDATLTVNGTVATLGVTAADLTTLGLNLGEWLFVGGDGAAEKFATGTPFYGRISSIAAKSITLEEFTGAPLTDTGATKTIRIFFGTFLKNENVRSLIKRRSYQVERQLGDDGSGTQSQVLVGAVPNELTINVPQTDKINVDLTFVALDEQTRTGTQGVKAGTRVSAPGEEAYNTSSDIFRQRVAILGQSSPLFGYVTEAKIVINNGVKANKAIGVLGGFDTSAADFEVSGSLSPYFQTIAAVQAVRNNADVSFNLIASQLNAGFVVDMPLITLAGGRVSVEKDNAIMIPVDSAASANKYGFTLALSHFPYLPTVGMPS
jgi:hypothetical protein